MAVEMADVLIHGKQSTGEEILAFPYTRYDNVMGRPKLITDINSYLGAPFALYQTATEEVDDDVIITMFGDIF